MTLSTVQRAAAIVQQQTGHGTAAPQPDPTPVRRHGVDTSNYTGPLSQLALTAWKTLYDVGFVIVQAIDPPPGYPLGQTVQHIKACQEAGIDTDVYIYLWTKSNVEQDVRTKLALLNGLEDRVGRVWLDVEDTTGATVAARLTAIRQALAVLDGWCSAHGKPLPGIYTGKWYFDQYLPGVTEFSDRPLWVSQYDGIADVTVFRPFAGWTRCVVKQYTGTSTLAGVGGVDLDVM